MEIRILGAGSGMPSRAFNSSAVLLHSAGQNFLLDAGDGISKRLLELASDPHFLDAVIITHYHPDHVSGVFLLIQMLYLAKRSKVLPLFLPERTDDFLKILQMFYTFPQKFGFELQILPMKELNQRFPQLRSMKNDHLIGYSEIITQNKLSNLQNAYSIRLSALEGDFVYSSDITSTDSIAALLHGAHTALVDAGHPEPEQILKLRSMGLNRILLTHQPKAELLQVLTEEPGSLFEVAREGCVYQI